jgi:Nuclease-related domain
MSKLLELRRDDRCASCGTALPAGTTAYWLKSERVTKCVSCHDAAFDQSQSSPGGSASDLGSPPPDVAGGSANAEYLKRADRERRRQEQAVAEDAEWREKVKSEQRLLGPVVAAFTPKPVVAETQSTKAWKTGAEGEERVAEVLTDVAGIEVLHDRRWPGTRSSNIDHIVIGPAGVFVIDAKKYQGRIELVDKGSFFKPDWRLYVNGRNETKRVDSMHAQVEAVRGVLSQHTETPVFGVLCFIGADWGLFGPRKLKTLHGVTMLWPLKLPEFVTTDGSVDVAATAAFLRSALKPAR